MEETPDLKPWEVPPDEAYWQALLNEGEYGEALVSTGPEEQAHYEEKSSLPLPKVDVVQADVGSQSQEYRSACWERFLQYQAESKPVELRVVSSNRGGLLVKWDGVAGFIPASQLCDSVPYDDEQLRQEALARRIGTIVTLKVIEVDPAKTRLILSERAVQRSDEPRVSVLDMLTPGDIRRGRVTNLCAFGAFVDLGGVEGLVHISEISWSRVSHPADLLQVGQEVDVYVLNVEREQRRIGLSLKRLQPDPWSTVETRYKIGQVISGVVTSIAKFGVFVRLDEGLEGLAHTMDLGEGPPDYHQSLRAGEIIQVRIASIEPGRHRIGLSFVE
jgi:small subunit ribosomal protein S1